MLCMYMWTSCRDKSDWSIHAIFSLSFQNQEEEEVIAGRKGTSKLRMVPFGKLPQALGELGPRSCICLNFMTAINTPVLWGNIFASGSHTWAWRSLFWSSSKCLLREMLTSCSLCACPSLHNSNVTLLVASYWHRHENPILWVWDSKLLASAVQLR